MFGFGRFCKRAWGDLKNICSLIRKLRQTNLVQIEVELLSLADGLNSLNGAIINGQAEQQSLVKRLGYLECSSEPVINFTPYSSAILTDIKYLHLGPNLIAQLCDKYGSDKGSVAPDGVHVYPWFPHSYASIYELFFYDRFKVKAVFECGLGTNNTTLNSNMTKNGRPGASLYVWRDYFPQAQIYGADIDKDILFSDERIATAYMDQTDPKSVTDYFAALDVSQFDIMIDDGLHEFKAGVCLFENSFSKLSLSGLYIIEDIRPQDLPEYQTYFTAKSDVQVQYLLMGHPKRRDNNLIIIRKRMI